MYYYMPLLYHIFTSFLKPMYEFASNFERINLGWTSTKIDKQGVTPISMELWVILLYFWPIHKKSSTKPCNDYKSYALNLIWRVPGGFSFSFVQIRSL